MPEIHVQDGPATENPRTYARETYSDRQVSRLVDRNLHQPDRSVANFRGDVEEMLADGEFYGLDDRDLRLLSHIYRAGVRPSRGSPEGAVVSLSGRQWGAFIGIRRKFLWHRRNPANLINLLRSRRASAKAQSTEAVPACPVASTPITENETKP